MADLTLIIGNKNYSSWSLRPWLLLKQLELPFDELRIPLFTQDSAMRVAEYSPTGLLPALRDGELTVWDSLAICEYVAELQPNAWPRDPAVRAVARAVSAEMHAGFAAVRQELPMNCRLQLEQYPLSDEVQAEVERIGELWTDCRRRYGAEGPFLFGRFSIADAMFAPVAVRFMSYGVPVAGEVAAYRDTILALPAVREWLEGAEEEYHLIERNEA